MEFVILDLSLTFTEKKLLPNIASHFLTKEK